MANKSLYDHNIAVEVPLTSDEQNPPPYDELSPPDYQHPTIEFYKGWKDRGFTIIFWIYIITVITLAGVLGIPVIVPYIKHIISTKKDTTPFDANVSLFIYSLGGAAATASLTSCITFFVIQRCAGQMITCALILIVFAEIALIITLLSLVPWTACILPVVLLITTLTFIERVRKRIPFAEVHLQVGCAVLRRYFSLIFVALFMLLVEFLWLALWCLMVLGILHATGRPILNINKNSIITNNTTTTTRSELMNKNLYMTNNHHSKIENGSLHSEEVDNGYPIIGKMIVFILLLLWYWAAITFANIVHFITACTVGRWWFPADAGELFNIGTSFKRAFTTNFGTICFGSLIEAIIKALRTCAKDKGRKNICSVIAECILACLEEIIGFITDWAFVYAALTGQSFIKSGRSFFHLFKQRGWTMIVNDTLIQNCLTIVNVLVGFVAAGIGGFIVYMFTRNMSEKMTGTIVSIVLLSFFIGMVLSIIMTTILSSCVRGVFICFALNPAALGATHPKYLQKLSKVWHEFYPDEFAACGYDHHRMKYLSMNAV